MKTCAALAGREHGAVHDEEFGQLIGINGHHSFISSSYERQDRFSACPRVFYISLFLFSYVLHRIIIITSITIRNISIITIYADFFANQSAWSFA